MYTFLFVPLIEQTHCRGNLFRARYCIAAQTLSWYTVSSVNPVSAGASEFASFESRVEKRITRGSHQAVLRTLFQVTSPPKYILDTIINNIEGGQLQPEL